MVFIRNNYFIGILISFVLLVSACAQQTQQPIKQQVPALDTDKVVEKVVVSEQSPSLKIISPSNNELIKNSKITINLKPENFNIVPIGSPVKDNEGHFHVWLDSEKKVTTDSTIIFENVVSGKHQIVAELVKSDHSSLSPKVTQAIIVNVESDYVPSEPIQQPGVREYTVEADDSKFAPSTIQAKIGEAVRINFKFRDSSIYYGGLDVRGPFEDVKYRLKGEQPITREFVMKAETIIKSFWPATGVKKAELTVEVEK